MSALYIETSAVLRWMFGQEKAELVRDNLANSSIIMTSSLTLMETERALWRAEQLAEIRKKDRASLLRLFRSELRHWLVFRITEAVEHAACRPFPVEPIRTLDAIHLATASIVVAAYPDIRVLTFNDRVKKNAQALGFYLVA